MRVPEHWQGLSREAVESPSLGTLRSHLAIVLGDWLQVVLLEQGVGPDALQRSPPTSAFL